MTLGALDTPCQTPYVRVVVPARASLTAIIAFDVAVEPQATQPALPKGRLRAGEWRLRVVTPIVDDAQVAAVATVMVE